MVCLVYSVEQNQLDEPDRPERPDEPDRPHTKPWRELAGISKITITGEGKVGFSPLMRAFKTPRLIPIDRLESQAVDPSVDQMSQARAGVFNQLGIGGARRRPFIVAPASDPVPLPGGISVIEPNLENQSSRTDLLKPRENAAFAIFV